MERCKERKGTATATDHCNSIQSRHEQSKGASVKVREKLAAVMESQLVSVIHLHQLYLYGWRKKAWADINCKAYAYLGNESDMEESLSQVNTVYGPGDKQDCSIVLKKQVVFKCLKAVPLLHGV